MTCVDEAACGCSIVDVELYPIPMLCRLCHAPSSQWLLDMADFIRWSGFDRKHRPVHGTKRRVFGLLNVTNLIRWSGCDRKHALSMERFGDSNGCSTGPTCCVAVAAIANTALSMGDPILSEPC